GILGGVGQAVDDDPAGADLGGLTLGRRRLNGAVDGDAGADAEMKYLGCVVGQRVLGDDLDVAHAAAVVQLQEAEAALGVAARPHPALQTHVAADRFHLARLRDRHLFHDRNPSAWPSLIERLQSFRVAVWRREGNWEPSLEIPCRMRYFLPIPVLN